MKADNRTHFAQNDSQSHILKFGTLYAIHSVWHQGLLANKTHVWVRGEGWQVMYILRLGLLQVSSPKPYMHFLWRPRVPRIPAICCSYLPIFCTSRPVVSSSLTERARVKHCTAQCYRKDSRTADAILKTIAIPDNRKTKGLFINIYR